MVSLTPENGSGATAATNVVPTEVIYYDKQASEKKFGIKKQRTVVDATAFIGKPRVLVISKISDTVTKILAYGHDQINDQSFSLLVNGGANETLVKVLADSFEEDAEESGTFVSNEGKVRYSAEELIASGTSGEPIDLTTKNSEQDEKCTIETTDECQVEAINDVGNEINGPIENNDDAEAVAEKARELFEKFERQFAAAADLSSLITEVAVQGLLQPSSDASNELNFANLPIEIEQVVSNDPEGSPHKIEMVDQVDSTDETDNVAKKQKAEADVMCLNCFANTANDEPTEVIYHDKQASEKKFGIRKQRTTFDTTAYISKPRVLIISKISETVTKIVASGHGQRNDQSFSLLVNGGENETLVKVLADSIEEDTEESGTFVSNKGKVRYSAEELIASGKTVEPIDLTTKNSEQDEKCTIETTDEGQVEATNDVGNELNGPIKNNDDAEAVAEKAQELFERQFAAAADLSSIITEVAVQGLLQPSNDASNELNFANLPIEIEQVVSNDPEGEYQIEIADEGQVETTRDVGTELNNQTGPVNNFDITYVPKRSWNVFAKEFATASNFSKKIIDDVVEAEGPTSNDACSKIMFANLPIEIVNVVCNDPEEDHRIEITDQVDSASKSSVAKRQKVDASAILSNWYEFYM